VAGIAKSFPVQSDDHHQGRFKSFPVQSDEHLLGRLRNVEWKPLSAGLVDRAQLWLWGSLWSRTRGTEAIKALLSPWQVERPANWTARVTARLTTKELDRVRMSIERGRPYGDENWVRETVKDLGLEQTVLPEGRPRKASESAIDATS
jgi:putative transposase